MSKEREIQQLAEHFRAMEAPDPESWACSQVNEGINQFARYVFLRQAWTCVNRDEDTSWIDKSIAYSERNPDAPCAGSGPALKRILAAGATREDIAEVVRIGQYETLFGLM